MIKKILLLISYSFVLIHSSFGQAGTWTWICGDSAVNSQASGILGSSSVNNHPRNLYQPMQWKDKQGNFWLYGGVFIRNTDALQYNNSDLWKYNPVNKQWTWVKGSGALSQQVHGNKGTSDKTNTPGDRVGGALSWVDTSGNFWLMGGQGNGDDLWRYSLSDSSWTWVWGDTSNVNSKHGARGVANASNTPGHREETTSAWTDASNNLWLYGGFGWNDNGQAGGLSDLWKYSIHDNVWTWMRGSADVNLNPIYGTKGVADTSNEPGARWSFTNWKDLDGNFWIMGGADWSNDIDDRNDVWKYDLHDSTWSWMSGADSVFSEGNYHASCTFDSLNEPFARFVQASSATDSCGKFWMFGGAAGDLFVATTLNDLWVFDPSASGGVKWNLVKGTDPSGQQPEHYGTKGTGSLLNMPPVRAGSAAWWGNDNKFYVFGGQGGTGGYYADMWMFTPDTSCVHTCSVASVLPPHSNFQANKTALCADTCIDFTDLSTNATAWQWYFEGAADSMSTAQNPKFVCYPKTGTYDVTLITYNSSGQNSVTFNNYISVFSPKTPVILQSGILLYINKDTSYASYQWSDTTALIPGATDTAIIITHNGNYNVEVKNKIGCKKGAGTIVSITGNGEFTVYGLQFMVSPNPTTGELRIINDELRIERVEIYNLFGMMIKFTEPETVNRKPETVLDVSALSPGVYFLQIKTESMTLVRKFVKE